MKQKKAFLLVLMWFIVFPSFAVSAEKVEKKRILCSMFPVFQFTRNVAEGSKGVNVEMLLPSNLGCPHDYSLTPQDVKKITSADVLIINGLGLEEFIPELQGKVNPKLIIVDSSKGVSEIYKQTTKPASRPKKGEHHHHESDINPHLFSNPRYAAGQVMEIAEALSSVDPANRSLYQKNAFNYVQKLLALSSEFKTVVKKARNKKIVTVHEVFDYLAKDCGLSIVVVLESYPGVEPSASEILTLIKNMKKSKPAAIFTEPQYPEKIAKMIGKETKIPVLALDPVASGPVDAPLNYYETIMKKNISTFKEALNVK